MTASAKLPIIAPVNGDKSAVARPWERKFLAFSFTDGKEPKRRIAPKALDTDSGSGSGS